MHSSDWHLGKRFLSKNLLSEQSDFLNFLLQKIDELRVEVFILAGDIFDIPHPPIEAIHLFNNFLSELRKRDSLQSIIIPGNHDSSRFLASLDPLVEGRNIHLVCDIHSFETPLTFEANQQVRFYPLPYFKWSDLVALDETTDLENINEIHILEKLFSDIRKSKDYKNIFIGHHLFGNYSASGSEQGLHLSGIDTIPINLLKNSFDALLLGHIHRTQVVSKQDPLAIYSGAPLPFRFTENSQKNIILFDIDPSGPIQYEKIEIPSFLKLHSFTCNEENWRELIQHKISELAQQKHLYFFEVILDIDTPNTALTDAIKEFFKEEKLSLLNLRTNFTSIQQDSENELHENIEDLSTEKLFEIYYENLFGSEKLPEEIKQDFTALLQECRNSITTNKEEVQ